MVVVAVTMVVMAAMVIVVIMIVVIMALVVVMIMIVIIMALMTAMVVVVMAAMVVGIGATVAGRRGRINLRTFGCRGQFRWHKQGREYPSCYYGNRLESPQVWSTSGHTVAIDKHNPKGRKAAKAYLPPSTKSTNDLMTRPS